MTDEPLPRLRTPPVVADPAAHGSATSDAATSDSFPQLLAAARAGDQAAFACVYRDLHPRLLRYAYVLVGQDAEDVVADSWLQIARDLDRFTGDLAQFRAWTARIVRNRAIDHVRAQARRPQRAAGLDAVADRASSDDTAQSAARAAQSAETTCTAG